jgi:hypothetical protein
VTIDWLSQSVGMADDRFEDSPKKRARFTFSSVSDFQIPKCFAFLLFSLASLQLYHLQEVSPQAFISNTDRSKYIESQHAKNL